MPHIHEKIDFTVDVFIVFQNKVLIRKHEKYHKWLSVGGHIELDENPNQAALREVMEEVGLHVTLYNKNPTPNLNQPRYTELIPPVYLNIHTISNTHQHMSHVYFAQATSNYISPQTDHEKDAECIWLTLEELKKHSEIDHRIKFYAKKALEVLGS